MKLSLSVELGYVDGGKTGGELSFTGDGKSKAVKYHFNEEPKKNLEKGDQLDISFFDGDEELRIQGIYPEVLKTVPHKAVCFWSLAKGLIYNLYVGYEGSPVKSVKQEMSGDVNEETFNLIFSASTATATT